MAKIKATCDKGKDFYMKHLSANDYYSEKESIAGYWKGSLAENFDLENKIVSAESFAAFQKNINPATNKKLTLRTKTGSIRFYDFQGSTQKSVSIMSIFDSRLVEAHKKAVDFAMLEMERLAAVRIRKGENSASNKFGHTGNFIYAQFNHDSSRSLDPQLHTHNVVANVTWDEANNCYKALETRSIIENIKYFGKLYQHKAAQLVAECGYELIDKYDKGKLVGFEIAGVDAEILKRFSKRRAQIETEIQKFQEAKGRSPNHAEISIFSRITRDRKLAKITTNEVKQLQLNQFSAIKLNQLQAVKTKSMNEINPYLNIDNIEIDNLANKVVLQLFERQSIISEYQLKAEILGQSLGEYSTKQVLSAIENCKLLQGVSHDGHYRKFTIQRIIDLEQSLLKYIDDGKNKYLPLNTAFRPFQGEKKLEDTKNQAQVITHLLSSKDRFMLLRGVAGTGKTTTLMELCNGLKSAGHDNIKVIAPTNSSTDVLRQEGFSHSETVAKFILRQKHQTGKTNILIIDESGLNSLREGVELLEIAQRDNLRVIFVGDAMQHSSVDAGDFFRLLQQYSSIDKVELIEVRRQKNKMYREGVTALAQNDYRKAFAIFDKNGWIVEGEGKYIDNAVDDFMHFSKNGKSIKDCLAVMPTHKECDKFTLKLREKLKQHKLIGEVGVSKQIFKSYNLSRVQLLRPKYLRAGEYLMLTSNVNGVGNAGEMIQIVKVDSKYIHTKQRKIKIADIAGKFQLGAIKKINLCDGDIIRFNVNDKKHKITNGYFAKVRYKNDKISFHKFNYDFKKQGKKIFMKNDEITFKDNFVGLDYGFATTSHRAQGLTCKNVIVAAERLSRTAFYVGGSRGKLNLRLHCPDKRHLLQNFLKRNDIRESNLDIAEKNKKNDIPTPLEGIQLPAQNKITLFASKTKKIRKFLQKFGLPIFGQTKTINRHINKEAICR